MPTNVNVELKKQLNQLPGHRPPFKMKGSVSVKGKSRRTQYRYFYRVMKNVPSA